MTKAQAGAALDCAWPTREDLDAVIGQTEREAIRGVVDGQNPYYGLGDRFRHDWPVPIDAEDSPR